MNNNSESQYVVGADIGGSHITAAIVDMENRCLFGHGKVRKRVNSKGSLEHILGTWETVLEEVLLQPGLSIDKVAFAMPGPFDYQKGISLITGLDKFEAIYGVNIRAYIAGRLNIPPDNILFRNDAEAFLHGEMFCGAGADLEEAAGLTLGTGFGSAFSKKGVTADLNLGSELFKSSIADNYFSTRWFIQRYMEMTGEAVADVKEMMNVIGKDGQGLEIFEEFACNLASFLAPYLLKYSCSNVILGGNIAHTRDIFLPTLCYELAGKGLEVNFKHALLNEDAALIGAAASFEKIVI